MRVRPSAACFHALHFALDICNMPNPLSPGLVQRCKTYPLRNMAIPLPCAVLRASAKNHLRVRCSASNRERSPPKSASRNRTSFEEIVRRISPIPRTVASLNRKRDALPPFGGATPKGEGRSPVLDTETALPAGYPSTH